MPARPSINRTRTRTGPGGAIKTLIIGCKAESAVYLVYRVQFPTPIVKDTQEMALNAERDDMAEEWNGKVMSQKKVRADGRIGRDFTIRGKPVQEEGLVTIRVREYLDGRSIYAVLVVSAPNRELPEDTGRFLGSLMLGAGRVRAAGKPEPEHTGTDLPGWGLAIDPGKDCQFLSEAKNLSLKMPGTWHDLNPDSGKLNAPRVVRTVEGDFVVTAKVSGDFRPGGKSDVVSVLQTSYQQDSSAIAQTLKSAIEPTLSPFARLAFNFTTAELLQRRRLCCDGYRHRARCRVRQHREGGAGVFFSVLTFPTSIVTSALGSVFTLGDSAVGSIMHAVCWATDALKSLGHDFVSAFNTVKNPARPGTRFTRSLKKTRFSCPETAFVRK